MRFDQARYRFEVDGFECIPGLLCETERLRVSTELSASGLASGNTRCLLGYAWCAALAKALRRNLRMAACIPADFLAVQCTYFEKSAQHNWLVPLHQGLSVPVAERVDHPNLCGWSKHFVQAPSDLLSCLIAVRLHIDDCGPHDGALRVILGSHVHGRISASRTSETGAQQDAVPCIAEAGDALIMRPLLLHASSKSSGASRRRVLHFVIGPRALPYGLRWPDTPSMPYQAEADARCKSMASP
jgi:hypothetical protein